MVKDSTLIQFDRGTRIKMLSGPHIGRTGTRGDRNTSGSDMILVKFDGDAFHSMVSMNDKCEAVQK